MRGTRRSDACTHSALVEPCPATPSGRPKAVAEVRALAQQYARAALETLAHIMQHGSTDTARVAAAQAILDRG
jgi:hypothetical protein